MQKNEIFQQIEKKIKNKIIINKNDMRDQKVKQLHNQIKQKMQKKAELEEEKQKHILIIEMHKKKILLKILQLKIYILWMKIIKKINYKKR